MPATDSYPRPMLTVDVVALTSERDVQHRRVLLIERKNPPFAGSWALPGGFVDEGEQARQAAPRELEEETGLKAAALELLDVYDTPGRDPRGWTVSVAFLARLDGEEAAVAADDASDARWFPVDELPKLAFDHAKIIADALSRL